MGSTYVGSADYFHSKALSSRLALPSNTRFYKYIDGSATVKYYTYGRGDGQYYIHRAAFAQGEPQTAVLPEYVSDDDTPRDLKQILAEESNQRAKDEFRAICETEERQRAGFDPTTQANAAARCFVDTIDEEDEARTRKRIEQLKWLMEDRNHLAKIIAGDYDQSDPLIQHINQHPGVDKMRQQEFERLNNRIADLMAGASPTPTKDAILETLANPRFQGSLMLVGGVLEMVAGAVIATGGAAATPTAVGTAPGVVAVAGGVALTVNGADVALTGWRQFWTGQDQKTLLNQAATGIAAGLGTSEETQNTISTFTDYTQAFAGMSVGTATFAVTRAAGKAGQTTRAVETATNATKTTRGTHAVNAAEEGSATRTAAVKPANETPSTGRATDGESVPKRGDPVVVTRGEYIGFCP